MSQKLKKQKPGVARKSSGGGGGGYAPPYAALVVDAKTGKVLHSDSADEIRHPASLTKVMTLYILFDELERGGVTLKTPLTVSAQAARQAPSKLGLRPGQTIMVEDAIKALVTKSANDIAVTIAENIGGGETAFANRMTRKARALGMNSTVYVNASGLPDPRQVTTARDLALLGRAIQDNHPTYYKYFSTRSFAFAGQTYGNHNRLLGNVKGVDGIKTGYVRASGFNLLTSAKDNDRSIVAVVLGGRSSASRDARMRELVLAGLDQASGGKRSAPLVAERAMPAEPLPALAPLVSERAATQEPAPLASAVPKPLPRPAGEPVALPAPLVAAVVAATQPVSQAPVATAATAEPAPTMTPEAIARRVQLATAMATTTPQAQPQDNMRWVVGAQSKTSAPAYTGGTTPGSPPPRPQAVAQAAPPPAPIVVPQPATASLYPAPVHPAQLTASIPAPQPAPVQLAYAEPAVPPAVAALSSRQEAAAAVSTPPKSGWIIQIGATPDAVQAENLLIKASTAVSSVDKGAEPFTESVEKNGVTLYRARYAGFSERGANAACQAVKRASLSCFTLKN